MRALIGKLARLWAVRSLFVGGISTIIDISCNVAGVELFHLPKVPSGVAGVIIGASFGFLLNKYFAFEDKKPSLPQAIKYAVVFGSELGLWAGIDWMLIHLAGVPYPLAKFASDIVIFTGVHLLMLRFVVFPRGPSGSGGGGDGEAEDGSGAALSASVPR